MKDRDIVVVVLVAETANVDDLIRGPGAETVVDLVPETDDVGTDAVQDHVTENVIEAVVVTKIANPRRKMMMKML